ncbi:response regulator transcription factor [uncultured Muribaculum sp.]|uniref:Response regulator transcription factor n=1 Tax=Muribaculum caecicola TaxID=3038144 RepID=A0AC61S6Z7_9BACT|nr:response regulator transcription factor [uncultured Muribaculum sp.]THG54233.1 response regulator transcription factor [Muribaculum caecicola]
MPIFSPETENNNEQADSDSATLKKLRILVVENDFLLCELMKYSLESEGYAVDVCVTAEEAMSVLPRMYSLIIANVSVLGQDSAGLGTYLRQNGETADIPLVFISSSETEEGIISAYESGVDAFLKKPFSMREMVARINAVMRRYKRTPSVSSPKRISHDDLCVNLVTREASMAEEPLDMTMQECQLLGFLMLNRNKLYSAEEIVNELWPECKLKADPHVRIMSMIDSIKSQIGVYSLYIVADDCFSYAYVEAS